MAVWPFTCMQDVVVDWAWAVNVRWETISGSYLPLLYIISVIVVMEWFQSVLQLEKKKEKKNGGVQVKWSVCLSVCLCQLMSVYEPLSHRDKVSDKSAPAMLMDKDHIKKVCGCDFINMTTLWKSRCEGIYQHLLMTGMTFWHYAVYVRWVPHLIQLLVKCCSGHTILFLSVVCLGSVTSRLGSCSGWKAYDTLTPNQTIIQLSSDCADLAI